MWTLQSCGPRAVARCHGPSSPRHGSQRLDDAHCTDSACRRHCASGLHVPRLEARRQSLRRESEGDCLKFSQGRAYGILRTLHIGRSSGGPRHSWLLCADFAGTDSRVRVVVDVPYCLDGTFLFSCFDSLMAKVLIEQRF